MTLDIHKPEMPKKTFILNRSLHLDKNNKVVEEDDVRGVRVLGTPGKALYEDEAKKYGLDDSHRLAPDTDPEQPAPSPAPASAPEPAQPASTPEPTEPGLQILEEEQKPEPKAEEGPKEAKPKTKK